MYKATKGGGAAWESVSQRQVWLSMAPTFPLWFHYRISRLCNMKGMDEFVRFVHILTPGFAHTAAVDMGEPRGIFKG